MRGSRDYEAGKRFFTYNDLKVSPPHTPQSGR
jgi:hypothetical protein